MEAHALARRGWSVSAIAELGLLVERARALLRDPGQGEFELGIEPVATKTPLLVRAGGGTLFGDLVTTARERVTAAAPRVVSTSSRVLHDVLAGVFTSLGFDVLGDGVFRDLVIARIVEPASILDTGRVLADLGRRPASEKTMRRTLARCGKDGYRDKLAALCFARARAGGDVSLCLYDVTTLYFEAEKEDDLRKVGYSKERRVDPQIVVGLLAGRHGFPLETGCFEGSRAETLTLLPVIRQFQARHGMEGMVVVAGAGMLSAASLRELDEAGLGFIVGSRTTKAPVDLESHFRWHGDLFTDGQVTRREGLYSSHIIDWRRLAREAAASSGREPARGRLPADPRDAQIARLTREKERLEQERRIAPFSPCGAAS